MSAIQFSLNILRCPGRGQSSQRSTSQLSRNAWAYLFRAHIYEERGNYERAFSDYRNAYEINPEIEDEYLELLLDESNIIED